ncbi:hypothetical protein [Pedobacter zeae]|uniref:Uncharacterized protein n=1 Tax=Pedobacter zeae TaxID=1737356 RepID=A0A7W6KCV1_9SPHI|nr:hypothetical protein [Pedobacter zeae]MBB4108335.1 hypothetical protein [Pedobacter zeae]GGG93476.1 hypothetical protein GCM10007422_03380 [Pedobacter zeae]
MSYSKEQREKNNAYIEKTLSNATNQDIADVIQQCNLTWPDDNEVIELVKAKQAEISLRATPEEIEEVFKNMRV